MACPGGSGPESPTSTSVQPRQDESATAVASSPRAAAREAGESEDDEDYEDEDGEIDWLWLGALVAAAAALVVAAMPQDEASFWHVGSVVRARGALAEWAVRVAEESWAAVVAVGSGGGVGWSGASVLNGTAGLGSIIGVVVGGGGGNSSSWSVGIPARMPGLPELARAQAALMHYASVAGAVLQRLPQALANCSEWVPDLGKEAAIGAAVTFVLLAAGAAVALARRRKAGGRASAAGEGVAPGHRIVAERAVAETAVAHGDACDMAADAVPARGPPRTPVRETSFKPLAVSVSGFKPQLVPALCEGTADALEFLITNRLVLPVPLPAASCRARVLTAAPVLTPHLPRPQLRTRAAGTGSASHRCTQSSTARKWRACWTWRAPQRC